MSDTSDSILSRADQWLTDALGIDVLRWMKGDDSAADTPEAMAAAAAAGHKQGAAAKASAAATADSGKPPAATAPTDAGTTRATAQQEDEGFAELAATREGRKNTVYLDSEKKPTVGIGHLVQPGDNLKVGDTITDEQVQAFWKADSAAAMQAARSQAAAAGITDPAFIPRLASVNFQLGSGWAGKFPKTWKLIMDGQYKDAAKEAANSAWAKQTPVRVQDFHDALRALPAKANPDA